MTALQLRPASWADLPHWQRWHRDRRVMRYLWPLDDTATEKQLHRAIAHWQVHGFGWWTLWHGDRAIGRCGLSYLGQTRTVELGYLLESSMWGRGLATQTARTVLSRAIRQRRVSWVVAAVHPENVASQRVLRKLGMEWQREFNFHHGTLWLYALDPRRFLSGSC